jgi:TPR repeat protein
VSVEESRREEAVGSAGEHMTMIGRGFRGAAVGTTLLCGAAMGVAAGLPREKDGDWLEVRSPHFTVVTDGSEGEARAAAKRFEQMRAVFGALFPKLPLDDQQPFIVVGARGEKTLRSLIPEYWEGRSTGVAALYVPDGYRTFLPMRIDLRPDLDSGYSMAYWGYAAHVIATSMPWLPLWTQRGLTEFYAHTTVEDERVVIGRAADRHVQLLRERSLIPVPELLAADRHSLHYTEERRRPVLDAESWLLVHYLLLGDKAAHRALLDEFLSRAAKPGQREGAEAALGDPTRLEAALEAYSRRSSFFAEAVPTDVDVSAKSYPARPLRAAEAYALRGAVHAALERWADAKVALDKAVQLDPQLASAWEEIALMELRRGHTGEARTAVDKALALDGARLIARKIREALAPQVRDMVSPRVLQQLAVSPSVTPAEQLARDEAACSSGNGQACVSAAGVYLTGGEGTAADADRAGELYAAGCAAGSDLACTALAVALHTGTQGLARDLGRAVSLYEKACELGQSVDCIGAGSILLSGEVPRDEARAARLFRAACERGTASACTILGRLTLAGQGVARDPARGRRLLSEACQKGDQAACDELSRLPPP